MSQEFDSGSDFNETPAEHQQRRFARRWKRRIRVLSPFLGIPLVLGALALSMDLVKHLPQAQAAEAQARRVKSRPLAKLNQSAERRVRIPTKSRVTARQDSATQPSAASINGLDPNSISFEMSNTGTSAERIPEISYRERSTR